MGGGGLFGFDESESKTKDIAPRDFTQLRGPYSAVLREEIEAGRGVTNPFAGVSDPSIFAAQLTPEELALVGEVYRSAFGSSETQAAADLRRRTIQGEFLEPDPRTRAAIQRPVLQAFEEATRQNVGAFTRAGQRVQESSPFFRAQAISERGLADALADIEVGLREAERGRQQEAAAQAEAIDATKAATQIQRLQVTALPRLVEDLGIQRGIEAFNQRVRTILAILGVTADVTRTVPGTFSESFGLQVL